MVEGISIYFSLVKLCCFVLGHPVLNIASNCIDADKYNLNFVSDNILLSNYISYLIIEI